MPITNAPTPPPKKRTAPAVAPKAEIDADKVKKDRTEGAAGLAQFGQAICVMFGNMADAGTIGAHAPGLIKETVLLGEKYSVVGNGLDALAAIGPWTGILTVALPFIGQVMTNHKLIPLDKAGMVGAVHPDVMASKMQTEIQRMQIDAMRAQQEELKRLAEERAEFEKMMAEVNSDNTADIGN